MNKSAMFQAVQTLKRKPMLFLLLLPMQLIPLLNLLFMPDLSKLLDINALINSPDSAIVSAQMTSMLSMFTSSLASLLSLAGIFLLLPPSLELLRDGAAGIESPSGWYMRGLRKHWWKPLVSSLIEGAVYAGLTIALYFAMVAVLMRVFIPEILPLAGDYGGILTPDELNGFFTAILPKLGSIIGIFALVIYAGKLLIDSLFGLFLPALADRSFGDSFLAVFSRKGFRKLPKLLGGLLLLGIVPGIIYVALGAEFWMTHGQPVDYLGLMAVLLQFIRSWECVLGLLITAFFSMLTYAFRFSVFQEIRAEEAPEQIE